MVTESLQIEFSGQGLGVGSGSGVSHALCFLKFEYTSDGLLHGIGPDLLWVDVGLRFLEPVEILLDEYEAIGSLFDQVIILVWMVFSLTCLGTLVNFSEDLESSSQISLLDFVHSILIIFV